MKKISITFCLLLISLFIYSQPQYTSRNGIYSFVELGIGGTIPQNENSDFSGVCVFFDNSPGYIFDNTFSNNTFSLGLGYSVKLFKLNSNLSEYSNKNTLLSFPIYFHGTYFHRRNEGKHTPFLNAKFGYEALSKEINFENKDDNVQWSKKYSGGLYASISIGDLYEITDEDRLSLSITCRLHNYSIVDSNTKVEQKPISISLNIGWFFY